MYMFTTLSFYVSEYVMIPCMCVVFGAVACLVGPGTVDASPDLGGMLLADIYSSPDGTLRDKFRFYHEKPLKRCLVTQIDSGNMVYHVVCDYNPTTEDLTLVALSPRPVKEISLDCRRSSYRKPKDVYMVGNCVCITFSLQSIVRIDSERMMTESARFVGEYAHALHEVIWRNTSTCATVTIHTEALTLLSDLRYLNLQHLSIIFPENAFRLTPHLKLIILGQFAVYQNQYLNHILCGSRMQLFCLSGNELLQFPREAFLCETRANGLFLDVTHVAIEWQNITRTGSGPLFPRQNRIKKLSLTHDSLEELESDNFLNVGAVDYIDLRFNSLAHIPMDLFKHVPNLTHLHLGYNRLLNIDSLVTPYLGRLQSLTLEGNRIVELPVSFYALRDLYVLILSANRLSKLPLSCLENNGHVYILLLDDNEIRHVATPSINATLGTVILNISSNHLQDVSDVGTIASFMPHLRLFWISNNKLRSLPPHPLLCDGVKTVDLGSNLITEIPPGMYRHMAILLAVQMKNNSISALGPFIFEGLHSLEAIQLQMNSISDLSPFSFQGELNLVEFINLGHNMITSIPAALFSKLPSLRYLLLDWNHIANIGNQALPQSVQYLILRGNNITDFSLKGQSLPNVATLDIGHNAITTWSEVSLPSMPHLTVLKLDYNLIEHLVKGACSKMPTITHLYCSHNELNESTVFEEDVFSGCSALSHLDLSHNSINSVEQFFLFPTLARLPLTLLLSHNPIRSLYMPQYSVEERALYESMTNSLAFDSCLIESVNPYDLEVFTRLHRLDLRHNNITMIPEFKDYHHGTTYLFDGNPVECSCEISWLRLSETKQRYYILDICKQVTTQEWVQFTEVPISEFQCSVTYFCDTRNCDCFTNSTAARSTPREVHCSHRGLTQTPMPMAPSAIEIHLAFNHLETLVFSIHWIMQHTERLYLHDSEIRHIDDNAFMQFPHLTHLYLHHNSLILFSWELISNLHYLKVLTLHGNWLTEVLHPISMRFNQALAVVTLHNNNLTILDLTTMHSLASLPAMMNLSLGENPWNCSECHGPTMRDWLIENSKKISDLPHITCGHDHDRFNASSIFDIKPHLFGTYVLCKNGSLPADRIFYAGPIVGASFVALSISVIVFSLLYRFRRHIIIIALNRWPRLKKLRAELDVPNDVYIVHNEFNSAVRGWVFDHLYPKLSNSKAKYRIVSPDTFLGGLPKAESIRKVVELSKRTFVILSSDFMEDEWALFAFQSAHQRSLEEFRHRLTVIQFTENIPLESLDKTLRAYIEAKQYLQLQNRQFWSDLLHRLPPVTNECSEIIENLDSTLCLAPSVK